MGLFCVNMHFRATDDKTLSAAVIRRGVTDYRVLPAKNGWTSLYEAEASNQDDQRIRDLTAGLSRDLGDVAIAFLCHDSDIACYWLFENGQLVDEYNSSPDYFDSNATGAAHSGGQPDVLLCYCRPGVRRDDLDAILGDQPVFAESIIERLADALAIDEERALTDYRDAAEGEGPNGFGGDDDDDGGDGDDEGPRGGSDILASGAGAGLGSRLARMLGVVSPDTTGDPQVEALIAAATRGDTDEIDRLLADGVEIDAEAPTPLPTAGPVSGMAQFFAGGVPKVPMTPLLAAVANKQRAAAEHLLDCGANPNHTHPLFGTPVHAAAGAAETELLERLLDRGGDVNARNARGQTPLQVVEIGRASVDRLAHARSMMESMGIKIPGLADQLSKITLPTEGWDDCEELLRSHGAV
jgi:hypothetical protein